MKKTAYSCMAASWLVSCLILLVFFALEDNLFPDIAAEGYVEAEHADNIRHLPVSTDLKRHKHYSSLRFTIDTSPDIMLLSGCLLPVSQPITLPQDSYLPATQAIATRMASPRAPPIA